MMQKCIKKKIIKEYEEVNRNYDLIGRAQHVLTLGEPSLFGYSLS